MHKKRNRRKGQGPVESQPNMSSSHSSVVAGGGRTETVGGHLDHKEHGMQSVRSKSHACNCDHHGHDPRVLKAKMTKSPVLPNGCKETQCSDIHHKHSGSAGNSEHHSTNVEINCETLQTVDNGESQAASERRYANKSTSMQQSRSDHPNGISAGNATNEPISELTKLVKNIDIQNDLASRGATNDLSGALISADDDVDDEMLAEFGASGAASSSAEYSALDHQHDEELPASLSDFVLGYRNDSFPIASVPPNDDDIDVIKVEESEHNITLVPYESELQMSDIMRLITKDLSEPYSIYTYRYFIHNWPQLCFLVSATIIQFIIERT